MKKKGTAAVNGNGHLAIITKPPKNSDDVKGAMSKLFADVRNRQVTPMEANAMCNVTGKLLKVVEMEYKYGKERRKPKRLALV